jgi:hypothetical protein
VIEIKLTLTDHGCILEVQDAGVTHTKVVTSEEAVRAYLAEKGAPPALITTALQRLMENGNTSVVV